MWKNRIFFISLHDPFFQPAKCIGEELQMQSHTEVHWKRKSTRGSTQNCFAKTSQRYFDRPFGFSGGVDRGISM